MFIIIANPSHGQLYMHHNIMSYLIFGLVEVGYWGGGGRGFFIGFSFRLGNLRLHTENQLCIMPGTALKVCVGGGGWVVVVGWC